MRLFLVLVFLFVAVPWLEIVLLLRILQALGFWYTAVIVLGTAVVGAALARRQGAQAWQNVRLALHQGRAPSKELFDGFCILCAGLLLLTPGLLTDAAGFLLLTPPVRSLVRQAIARRLLNGPAAHFTVYTGRPPAAGGPSNTSDQADIINVDVEKVELEDNNV